MFSNVRSITYRFLCTNVGSKGKVKAFELHYVPTLDTEVEQNDPRCNFHDFQVCGIFSILWRAANFLPLQVLPLLLLLGRRALQGRGAATMLIQWTKPKCPDGRDSHTAHLELSREPAAHCWWGCWGWWWTIWTPQWNDQSPRALAHSGRWIRVKVWKSQFMLMTIKPGRTNWSFFFPVWLTNWLSCLFWGCDASVCSFLYC